MSKRCMGCMELFSNEFEVCPHCGYVVGTAAEEAVHMAPGSLLYDRYIVGKVLGFGGFGVTYIGWDGKLEQKVAIKEYLPSEFSTRMPGQTHVTVFNGDKNRQFQDGLQKFVEEAKRLAKFQNEPGIVKIFDSFTENDTAYIVMEFLDGETLSERLKREECIPEDEAVTMLWPLMNSLQVVHEEGILHRDIAPDNIFLTKAGEVKLIDFGASRYATTSCSRSLTVIIKPGYSPEEQYRSRGDQGPHTDVYALAATLYKMVTGKTPPDAMERRVKCESQKKDILEEPHKLNKDISINRENAILNAMNVRIEDRTPDVKSFMEELNQDPPAKRRYGKIKKLDLYHWPLWMKIIVPVILALLLIFGALLITGVIDFPSLFTDEVVVPEGYVIVPDVKGLDKDEAMKKITASKLLPSPEGNVETEYVEAGKIVYQSPVGGLYLEENSTVVLTVSSGKGIVSVENGIATVPYVVWDTKEDAVSKLKQAGLGEPVITTEKDENVPAGKVISQSVEAGKEVAEGTQITLVISAGADFVTVPDVTGQTEKKAKAALTEKGFSVAVEYEKNDNVAEGKVLRQSVKAGIDAKKGDKVIITVSSGKPTVSVPNVVGKSRASAISALEGQGFAVNVLESYDSGVAAGNVIRQSPEGGSAQIRGATITIYVSKGPQPVWSEWMSKLPSGVTSANYNIETRTEYRYREKMETAGSSGSMSGWQFDHSEITGWSAWSSWSNSAVSASESRRVETRNIAATYKTQYNYSKWAQYSNGNGRNGPSENYWSNIWCGYYFERGWSDSRLSVWDTQWGYGVQFNLYGSVNDCWYNEKTQQVQLTPAYKQYRYQDAVYTYYFYKWSDWSGWSTTSPSGGKNIETETRIMYRYIAK